MACYQRRMKRPITQSAPTMVAKLRAKTALVDVNK
jgi:hypothetical protein